MLTEGKTVAEVRAAFCWDIPQRFNIGRDISDRWAAAEPDRVAIIHDDGSDVTEVTYGDLQQKSNRLANWLEASGICRGDRIGILLPQHPWTAVAHIAAWKMGAISIPLFMLFGPDALQYRLQDACVRVVITNAEGAAKLELLRDHVDSLERVLCIDAEVAATIHLEEVLTTHSDHYAPLDTLAEDPCLIIYTSGTTGNPKGALHAHRTLFGHLPGVEMSHDFLPQPGDKMWTPADWAWIGGLMDVLVPALHHGVPVVSSPMQKFDGEAAFQFIDKHRIRNAFLPPTALKMMRMAAPERRPLKVPMRSIASAGEALGAELLQWGRDVFGIWINEFYGQTECNMVVSSCGKLVPPQPGVMGFAVPGHEVQVISATGEVLSVGELGQIAVAAPDPVMFLEYWNQPQKTAEKYLGRWLLTGDTGRLVESGAVQFVGRDDDVITSAGYRIGPGEIENCLLGHPAVAMAAVVGKPDPLRTEIVKAFIQLNDGYAQSDTLVDELKNWVRTRLSAHEYPREIAFVEHFPLTASGKIIRRELRQWSSTDRR